MCYFSVKLPLSSLWCSQFPNSYLLHHLFVVVSTINSYCLIMLYYSFSIAPPRAAVQLCCCCCCGFARFTVQARIERSLSLSCYCSPCPVSKLTDRAEMGDFCQQPVHLSITQFLIFTSVFFLAFARALSLCRSVLTCIYQLRGKIDYYFLFVYFTYFNNLLICLSIDFYVHLVIVSLPNCVCVCVLMCMCLYVTACLLLSHASGRFRRLFVAARFEQKRTHAGNSPLPGWLVGRSVTLSILISLVNRLRRRFLSLDYLLEFCVCFALVFIQLFVYIILYFITFSQCFVGRYLISIAVCVTFVYILFCVYIIVQLHTFFWFQYLLSHTLLLVTSNDLLVMVKNY